MITEVHAKNFKGLDFKTDLGQLTLFIGPNGAGKSARSQTLTLSILGYLPSDGLKQPTTIFAAHAGPGEQMEVGFGTSNGDTFERNYKVGSKGSVTQEIMLNSCKLSQKQGDAALRDIGHPRIFDLKEFNDLSDQKKAELLLKLWPPKGDLKTLDRQAAEADRIERAVTTELRAAEKVIQRLTSEQSTLGEITESAMTLAEIKASIAAYEKELEGAQEELAKDRAEKDAKEQEARLTTRELELEAQAATAAQQQGDIAEREKKIEKQQAAIKAEIAKAEEKLRKAEDIREEKVRQGLREGCLAALGRVKAALLDAGCDTCAALLVVNKEMGGLNND